MCLPKGSGVSTAGQTFPRCSHSGWRSPQTSPLTANGQGQGGRAQGAAGRPFPSVPIPPQLRTGPTMSKAPAAQTKHLGGLLDCSDLDSHPTLSSQSCRASGGPRSTSQATLCSPHYPQTKTRSPHDSLQALKTLLQSNLRRPLPPPHGLPHHSPGTACPALTTSVPGCHLPSPSYPVFSSAGLNSRIPLPAPCSRHPLHIPGLVLRMFCMCVCLSAASGRNRDYVLSCGMTALPAT